jgi:predicted transcriptional regulator
MQTISMKLPDDLLVQLEREAKARRVTKSLVVRESLEKAPHRLFFCPAKTDPTGWRVKPGARH